MKHGIVIVGRDDQGKDFSFGSYETPTRALHAYEFCMRSPYITEAEKQTLRIVELVEKDITASLVDR